MRKILFAAAGLAALAGAAGLALAQDAGGDRGHRGGHGLFAADANNDGVLTRAESDAGRDAMFARLDADNNGELTREEMREGRGRRGDRGRGGMHGLRGADANDDGAITRDEFLARPTAMFDRMDANDDGVISADERPQRGERGERGERPPRADRPERPNPDTDGNGTISRAEFSAMGASMFERLDANDDGSVTRDEARAARGPRRGGE